MGGSIIRTKRLKVPRGKNTRTYGMSPYSGSPCWNRLESDQNVSDLHRRCKCQGFEVHFLRSRGLRYSGNQSQAWSHWTIYFRKLFLYPNLEWEYQGHVESPETQSLLFNSVQKGQTKRQVCGGKNPWESAQEVSGLESKTLVSFLQASSKAGEDSVELGPRQTRILISWLH